MPTPAKLSAIALIDEKTPLVSVYNRTPATYKWKDPKTGKEVVIPPGASGIVPEPVADMFKRVSNGGVNLGGVPSPSETTSALVAATARAENAERALGALQARLDALERKSQQKVG